MSKSNPYAAPARGHQKSVETPEADTPAELHVPDGTISEVLEWVGDDQERANTALEHETAHHARKTLLEALEEKLTGGDPSALVPAEEPADEDSSSPADEANDSADEVDEDK